MKKLLTAAMIAVCLSMAASALAAPLPVPTKLCLKFKDSGADPRFVKLLLDSKGVLNGVEYFGVDGSLDYIKGSVPVSGTAYRVGGKKLRMSLNGFFDLVSPGTATLSGFGYASDHLLRLDTGKGTLTFVLGVVAYTDPLSEAGDRSKIVTCNRLRSPKS